MRNINMIKEYRDYFYGRKITAQQAEMSIDYDEVYIDEDTNLVKQRNSFENKRLSAISYYCGVGEDEPQKVRELTFLCSIVCINERRAAGDCIIEMTREYREGIIMFKYRNLIDSYNRQICSEKIDLITDMPDYKRTDKYFYTVPDVDAIETLYAEYNSDGSLRTILYKPNGDDNDQDWEYYDAARFASLQAMFLKDLSYYLTARLEP